MSPLALPTQVQEQQLGALAGVWKHAFFEMFQDTFGHTGIFVSVVPDVDLGVTLLDYSRLISAFVLSASHAAVVCHQFHLGITFEVGFVLRPDSGLSTRLKT